MEELYNVVTGASQGLGRAFAYELARRNQNLILVSLPDQNLRELGKELQNCFLIKVHIYEIDLTEKENVLTLGNWINANFSIKMLINNAGMGGTERFEKASINDINNIIQLNVMATSLLTRQVLPNLQRCGKAYILNVSSLAAFSPIAYKTVYPASKAFVHSFSRGLYEELKNTNVFVSVVNPGPMKTNADVIKRIDSQGFFAKMTSLDPGKVAVFCLNRIQKRDTVIMVNHFSWLFLQVLPIWIKLPMLSKKIRKELS